MEIKHRKRVRHFYEPGHAHFLTFSCFHRLPLLSRVPGTFKLAQAVAGACGTPLAPAELQQLPVPVTRVEAENRFDPAKDFGFPCLYTQVNHS
ncbi:MAG: hypothetical protein U0796_17285 [Gemmatales bacterium]